MRTSIVSIRQIAMNPFKDWSVEPAKPVQRAVPAASHAASHAAIQQSSSKKPPPASESPVSKHQNASPAAHLRLRMQRSKRRDTCEYMQNNCISGNDSVCDYAAPPPGPHKKIQKTSVVYERKRTRSTSPSSASNQPAMINIESYYYGLYETGTENDSAVAVTFEATVNKIDGPILGSSESQQSLMTFYLQCPICARDFHSNNSFMDHLKMHAVQPKETTAATQCKYCLNYLLNHKLLDEHLNTCHPIQSKIERFYCIICSVSVHRAHPCDVTDFMSACICLHSRPNSAMCAC